MTIPPRVISATLTPALARPTGVTVTTDATIARIRSGALDSTAPMELINQEIL